MDDLHAAVGGEGLMDALLDVHGLFEGAEMADEDFPDGGLIPTEDVQLGEGAFDLRFDRLGLLHGLALVVARVDLHAVGVALGLFRGGQLDVVNGALNGGVGVARDGCQISCGMKLSGICCQRSRSRRRMVSAESDHTNICPPSRMARAIRRQAKAAGSVAWV